MKDILAMIMAGGNGERLYPLTRDRAKPAVPFGGIYRLVDFTLNNCINSGLRKIIVLTQYKSLSLERHLRLGWNIFHPELDEFLFPISAQMRISDDWYKGTADSIYQNLYFADKINPKYFLILSADHVYKMDYSNMLAFHKEKDADATVAMIEVAQGKGPQFGVIKVNDENKIVDFEEKPKKIDLSPQNNKTILVNMGVYIFNNDVLREFLRKDAHKQTYHDFGKDIIPEMVKRARVFAYNFKDENGKKPPYWRDVGTIDAYYEANMDLLIQDPIFDLYDNDWPIRTYQEQYPPAKMFFSQENIGGRLGICVDSLVSGGCIINARSVQNSVLSPHVRIDSHSEIRESILMEGVEVGRDCKIKRAIIDKGVKIPSGSQIGYNREEDRKRFFVSDLGKVVVPKGMKLSYQKRAILKEQDRIDHDYLQGVANFD
ncbi:MAG: glucose-1-phosphate adenylyltransferase [Thermodesulfobacteriota bacterium]|nr:glucose-1-phosphate adenylyltransferase [Thermodesulfobacteriota bacterium]